MQFVGDRTGGLFTNDGNIFELTPGERITMRKKPRSGFDTIVALLDEIGYYGYQLQFFSDYKSKSTKSRKSKSL